ncbi:hypothetical protein [Rubrivirga marina]|uniref:DUF4382 domain-containing protein n=1 Tax=Rubrivirga marina TaxID=1196024 RepID=A0A271J1W5_9BACT|nr:hypothetical protein [Rubrivirga marina]PAP77506.1 hypothetical protein BSZ37_14190 [Rubrivirga marina]
MRPALLCLLVALATGGCSLGDCSAETSRATTTGGLLLADGSGVGDTLTVAFVDAIDPQITVTTAPGVGVDPGVTPDGVVEVLYDAVTLGFGGDLAPLPLVARALGDTVYVYVDGTVDPGVFAPACSLPPASYDVEVRNVLVPRGTVAVRVALVTLDDVPAAAAEALRQSAEARRVARPTHI